MRRNPTPSWPFSRANSAITVEGLEENRDGHFVLIQPQPDLVNAVNDAIEAKFGSVELNGRFDADGYVEIRFHALA